jgi:N-dimethylarginine dimethylaminohydrolase
MPVKINKTVLMSGAEYFSDAFAINALMNSSVAINLPKAIQEHQAIKAILEAAGITVITTAPPVGCQDGVYVANWGLCRRGQCVLSSLPNKRSNEEPYAETVLKKLGQQTTKAPFRFSGQGDALPCGNLLFCGSSYRTDTRMHNFIKHVLGYEVISLQAIPKLDEHGQAVTNYITGWPDSCFYDLDLALSVLTPNLIAWCPEAFDPASQEKINSLAIDKISVSFEEASAGFACNLVSTGETVIMSAHAPVFQAAIEAHGLKTVTPDVTELSKGGGFIRCITLTLDND